jgi:hypothetical protein
MNLRDLLKAIGTAVILIASILYVGTSDYQTLSQSRQQDGDYSIAPGTNTPNSPGATERFFSEDR